jgi:hypothetical protein
MVMNRDDYEHPDDRRERVRRQEEADRLSHDAWGWGRIGDWHLWRLHYHRFEPRIAKCGFETSGEPWCPSGISTEGLVRVVSEPAPKYERTTRRRDDHPYDKQPHPGERICPACLEAEGWTRPPTPAP